MHAFARMTHHLRSNAATSVHRHATHPVAGVRLEGARDTGERAVTAVRPQPTAVPTDALPGPVPRRTRPPRWLDLRLVLGVLLVLGSVLLGARVVGAADATVPVWAVTGDLAAGTELHAGDLRAVDVRLGDAADAYLSTSTRATCPVGPRSSSGCGRW